MLFGKPIIIHSQREDGRHWLTTIDFPSMQIWPVARNHCRVGRFLANVIAAKLATLDDDVSEIMLTREDVISIETLPPNYPEVEDSGGEVLVRLVMQAGPSGVDNDDVENDETPQFVTPQPSSEWTHGYDAWITLIGRQLGIDAPIPCNDLNGYELEMAKATQELQRRIASLRARYLEGMDGFNLGFKVGLTTISGDKEYVWVSPLDWGDEAILACRLESQPYDCKGYKLGQELRIPIAELFDYAIGSESAGLVEGGLTQRIAEDYGLVVT